MAERGDEASRRGRVRSARIAWSAGGELGEVFTDRVVEATSTGATIATSTPASEGCEIRFDLVDDSDAVSAAGLARVISVDEAVGMRVEWLALGIDASAVDDLRAVVGGTARGRGGPPPLPVGRGASVGGGPPSLPEVGVRDDAGRPAAAPSAPSSAAGRDPFADGLDLDDVGPAIEPLDVKREGVIIGIDLGTTNTCAAYMKDGRPVIIPGRTGTNTIPSMITFDPDGSWYVGQRAADRHVMYPLRTVYGSKRLVGRTFRPELAAELQQHFAYPLGEAEGQRFGARIDNRVISMDTIAARVLDEVRATAELHLGVPVRAAVITVPAYFSEVQREAVRRAAREAELVVHRIVNEPTAAAVAYGHKEGAKARVAVWDFGGGTFDFSIVDIDGGAIEVVATGGDNFVGGSDFDDAIASYLLSAFQAELGAPFEPDAQQIARLREAAEAAKQALSTQNEHLVELPDFCRAPRRSLSIEVTRATFDELAKPLIDRTLSIAGEVMGSRGLLPADVDDVLLVGGSSRVPAVQQAVAGLFGRRPSKRINPDEAVALGAAVLADEIGATSTLVDIMPMSVGVGGAGLRFSPIVERYARLPVTREVTYDADLLGTVTLPLFQGESPDVRRDEYLCSVVIEDRSLWDKGRVTVTLSFDEHCVMAVEARNARSGRSLPVKLDRSRALDEVLRELGGYQVPAEPPPTSRRPPTVLGKVLGKLFKLFGR